MEQISDPKRMLKRLNRAYQYVKATTLMGSALLLASRHKYHEAIRKLDRVDENFEGRVKIELQKGLWYYKIDKNYDSLKCLSDAYDFLKDSEKYSAVNKQYLMCYVSVTGLDVSRKLGCQHQTPFVINYEIVDLKNVHKRLRSLYPLPEHPDWVGVNGVSVVGDLEEILSQAERGDVKAQRQLAERYSKGDGIPKDDGESAKWYGRAAEQGCVNAQVHLGVIYVEGRGVTQNYAEAANWFKRAAEQGDRVAQYNLGTLFEGGKGVQQSDKEAAKWFRSSAEQDCMDAQFNLGVLFTKGRGVPHDDMEAIKWYTRAAEKGCVSAQLNLGSMYDGDQGVPSDDVQAAIWYRRAAEQGDKDAQYKLGRKYREGRGVPADIKKALMWFHRAAKRGDAPAQLTLCDMYWQGEEVSEDTAQAFFWCKLAAAQDGAGAQKVLSLLTESMTSEDITEAERRFAAWKPRA